MTATATRTLLCAADPEPVERFNWDASNPVLLLCEHAGRDIPAALRNLQLPEDVLASHRGWDIGAEDIARQISKRLGAPLILQRYSRLVIDVNRPPGTSESIPEASDGIFIPGNENLSSADKERRRAEIFAPLDEAIQTALSRDIIACFSIHSYTPRMNGTDRPWNAGFLTRSSHATGEFLIQALQRKVPDLNLAMNQPYQIEDDTDWFVPKYAEERGLPHCLIEIRNDQIDHAEGAAMWAELLSSVISEFMETLE